MDDIARATSHDGRTFRFQATVGVVARPGDLVVLRPAEGDPVLAQILSAGDVVPGHTGPAGSGVLVGAIGSGGEVNRGRDLQPFATASLDPAPATLLESLQSGAGADLTIGTLVSGGVSVPARVRAQGFNRHTFMCGQSGSGKTYALGVLLERLLLATGLRMVVLDPNADFVRLGEARSGVPEEIAARIRDTTLRVLGPSSSGLEPLRMRFGSMPRQAQAAVFRLDPLVDRGEYNLFLHWTPTLQARASAAAAGDAEISVAALVDDLNQGGPDERALGQRVENLGLTEWEVWARDQPSAAEVVASGARATVLDLSGFRDPREPIAVSLDLIEQLWAQRASRTPTLVVIDEAHNVCPAQPEGSMQRALVDRLIQIAGEGRKYGLWLLLSTQRPSKIHPQVLSQCDNLVLMRMNSPSDVAELAEAFGFAPPAMIAGAPYFMQGEALVAGSFVPRPAKVRVGERFTVEGGRDVPVPVVDPE